MRFEELELSVQELKMRFGKVHLGHTTFTVVGAGITRVGTPQ